jgi:hypothetical protein
MASNYKTPTDEQLDAVTIVIDEQTHEQFYLVQSATDPTVTYQVRYNHTFKRWSCQCKGNRAGYLCWHLRSALEVGRQHAEEKRAEQEAAARLELEEAQMQARIEWANEHPYQPPAAQVEHDRMRCTPRPFSILR